MEAFKVPKRLNKLIGTYPNAKIINEIAKEGSTEDRIAITRLWLSEGIPYVFKDFPGIYETIRTWIAQRLNVHAKNISITGSARIGTSLSPNKLGNQFNEKSDLDFFVVSEELFDKLRIDFNTWSYDFEKGTISPLNDREEKFWKDNLERGIKLFEKGFFDPHLVPNREQYLQVKNISQTMWLLHEKLTITDGIPNVSKVSLRCYRNWSDYTRQTSLNLK